MARSFASGSTHYLEVDSAPVTAAPFTAGCWFYPTQDTANQALITILDKDVANHRWALLANGGVAGDPVGMNVVAGGLAANVQSTTGFTINTWHHACMVEESSTSRAVFIDGGSKATNTTNRTPANIDRLSIGRNGASIPTSYYDGRIAEVGIWDVVLTDNEIFMLAQGVSPVHVRPFSLVFYAPLFGASSPEPDYGGSGYNLTVSGSTQADHAPVRPMFGFGGGWDGGFTAAGGWGR